MQMLRTLLDDERRPVLVCDKEVPYRYEKDWSVNSPEKVYDLARELGCDRFAEEHLYCLCLDTKGAPQGLFLVSIGTASGTYCSTREVFQKALLCNAQSIVLWHNHPSGSIQPSGQDFDTTKKMKEAGELIGISVLDHIIIGDGAYASIRELNGGSL